MSTNRRLQYSLALNEALHQMMESDPSVFLIGQGVKSPWYVGNTAQDCSNGSARRGSSTPPCPRMPSPGPPSVRPSQA